METNSLILAFTVTLFAGLSTGIGSLLAFFTKTTNTKVLSIALGFSAGVMIYVSFIEILPKAIDILSELYGGRNGNWIGVAGFFTGIILIALIDKLVPSFENPHEIRVVEEMKDDEAKRRSKKLFRMGYFTAIAIAIHNFPEGFATFISVLADPVLGISIAIAIAIHNIPEGIAVSIPVYYATEDKRKAFKYSFLSGLAEPAGALAGYFILFKFLNDALLGFVFALVAGIMVFISLDQLLPSARQYGEHHLSIYGLFSGMLVMSVSLLLLV